MNAVDTNILVNAVDASEPEKARRAIELLDRLARNPMPLLLPWQAAVAFLATLRRWQQTGRISLLDVDVYLNQLGMPLPLAFPTIRVLAGSLELTSRFSLSHWDSMMLAACNEAGVTTLYSEDLANGMTYDAVTVVNPFRAASGA
jgi:predicted nucleic acid-binding protein